MLNLFNIKKEVVCTGLQVLNTGVSESELRELINSFGPDVEVVGFEACGITRDRPEKREQAVHDRDYLRGFARDVLSGLMYVRHPESAPGELDFLLDVAHYNPARYHVAAVMSVDFPRVGGGTVLSSDERKLVEKILDVKTRTGISLDNLFDSYRLGTLGGTGALFPEYSLDAFRDAVIGPRSLVQELYLGLTVAMHTPFHGVVIARQPYGLIHPTDGLVQSDVDVILVTPPGEALSSLSSIQSEQGTRLILSSALAERIACSKTTYEKAA